MRKNLLALLVTAGTVLSPQAIARDIEAEAIGRCEIPASAPIFDRRTGRLPSAWTIEDMQSQSPALPEVMVDGWKPAPAAADMLLSQIANEVGFAYSGPAGLPVVSWDGRTAPLADVIDDLVTQAGGDWSFDGKNLFVFEAPLPKTANARFMLPEDRDQRLATVDILRGFDIALEVTGGEARLTGERSELEDARAALSSADELRVYDVLFMRGRPDAGRYDWSALGAFSQSQQGAGGQFIFSEEDLSVLMERLQGSGDLVEDSGQSVAAPKGWKLAVPPTQCGLGTGEVIVGLDEADSGISLSLTGNGEEVDFKGFSLGTTALSVSSKPQDGWISMVAVRPRLVTFSGA